MFPIYKDTYERIGTPPDYGIIAERDETIQQADDLLRSVDYLESRSDLNHEKLGFFAPASSFPFWPRSNLASEPSPLECRRDTLKVCARSRPMNFVPRVKTPVLMVNGRYDFRFPFGNWPGPGLPRPRLTRWGQKAYSLRHRAHARRVAHYEGNPRLVRPLPRPSQIALSGTDTSSCTPFLPHNAVWTLDSFFLTPPNTCDTPGRLRESSTNSRFSTGP